MYSAPPPSGTGTNVCSLPPAFGAWRIDANATVQNPIDEENHTRLLRRPQHKAAAKVHGEVDGNVVVLRGLTRSPGHFANYTTWTFETDGSLITHVRFAWRPAN